MQQCHTGSSWVFIKVHPVQHLGTQTADRFLIVLCHDFCRYVRGTHISGAGWANMPCYVDAINNTALGKSHLIGTCLLHGMLAPLAFVAVALKKGSIITCCMLTIISCQKSIQNTG